MCGILHRRGIFRRQERQRVSAALFQGDKAKSYADTSESGAIAVGQTSLPTQPLGEKWHATLRATGTRRRYVVG